MGILSGVQGGLIFALNESKKPNTDITGRTSQVGLRGTVGECGGGEGPTCLTLNTRAIGLEDSTGREKVFGPRRSSRPIGCPIDRTALHHAFILLAACYGAWHYTIVVRGIGVDILPLQQHMHAPRSWL